MKPGVYRRKVFDPNSLFNEVVVLGGYEDSSMDDSCHIKMQFGSAFNSLDKGPFLLQVERMARSMLGVRAEVFMETMRDLNKPRQKVTQEDKDTRL